MASQDDLVVPSNLRRLSPSKYEKLNQLGEGPLGKVYLVQERGKQSLFAFKFMKVSPNDSESIWAMLEQLIDVSHPALCTPVGYSLPRPDRKIPLGICNPYFQIGSLLAAVKGGAMFSHLEKMKIMFGIAEGMRHLEAIGLAHGGLSLANVLIDEHNEPKVCDFGMGALRTGAADKGDDYFCYGVIVYSILTGSLLNPGARPELPAGAPECFQRLLHKCCSSKGDGRPTFEAIVLDFLRRDLALPLLEEQESSFRLYLRRTLCPSFTVRALFKAIADVKASAAENRKIFDRIRSLNARYSRLARGGGEQPSQPLPEAEPVPEAPRTNLPSAFDGRRMSLKNPNQLPTHLFQGSSGSRPVGTAGRRFSMVVRERPPQKDQGPVPLLTIPGTASVSLSQLRHLLSPRDQVRMSCSSGRLLTRDRSPESLLSGRSDYGICQYLSKRCGGNAAELGRSQITGKSCDPNRDRLLPHLINYDWKRCWISHNTPGAWVQFDFVNVQIYVTHYSIKTYRSGKGFSHLKSWLLQGFTGGQWVDLDLREDTEDLNGRSQTGLFQLTNPSLVTMIKLIQTGPNHSGDDFMILTNVEFYGEVEDENKISL
jgi:serine/threonine protein kinase